MTKTWISLALVATLAACNTYVPDNGPLDLNLGSDALVPPGVSGVPLGPESNSASAETSANFTDSTVAAAAAADDVNLRVGQIEASPSNAEPTLVGANLSDENDFDAVSSRQTIESDKERLAALSANYQVANVEALPSRSDAGPNIVAYALQAPNVKGQEWYSRLMLFSQSRFERNCAKYNSPDEAQRDLLAHGGPERDLYGIDPDGDGFACGWDPAPFIAAANAANNG